jgi:hypothetical protein
MILILGLLLAALVGVATGGLLDLPAGAGVTCVLTVILADCCRGGDMDEPPVGSGCLIESPPEGRGFLALTTMLSLLSIGVVSFLPPDGNAVLADEAGGGQDFPRMLASCLRCLVVSVTIRDFLEWPG